VHFGGTPAPSTSRLLGVGGAVSFTVSLEHFVVLCAGQTGARVFVRSENTGRAWEVLVPEVVAKAVSWPAAEEAFAVGEVGSEAFVVN